MVEPARTHVARVERSDASRSLFSLCSPTNTSKTLMEPHATFGPPIFRSKAFTLPMSSSLGIG